MSKATQIDKEIGKKIEFRRKLRSKTRGWLGEKVGVSYQQIQNYEEGKQKISASRLYEISALLEFDIIEFFPEIKQ